MSVEAAPFAGDKLEDCAELLAERHQRDRNRDPRLPARFEDPAQTRPLIEQARGDGRFAAVAVEEGVAGYLAGQLVIDDIRLRQVQLHGHAAAPGRANEAYRVLYAEVARRFLEAGAFVHTVELPAADAEAIEAWFGLGFGRIHAGGLRDVSPLGRAVASRAVEVREAGAEDAREVERLEDALGRYHAEPPMFAPYTGEDQARRRASASRSKEEAEGVDLLAVREGRSLGLVSLRSSPTRHAFLSPEGTVHLASAFIEEGERAGGIGSVLLEAALRWARERGYRWCSVGWQAMNIAGERFWLANGFRPVRYRLGRRIDERIAWATG
jgi:GNAT superfamily N-acetyltransferase